MDYEYIVKENDSPSVIAQRLVGDGNRWTELMFHNTILTPNKWVRYGNNIIPVYHLRIGQRLNIPNNWIKDIPNQLIHTTQGFIGYTDSDYIADSDSMFFDPLYTHLKDSLSQLEQMAVPFQGEIALYFCDERLAKDYSNAPGSIEYSVEYPNGGTNVSDCANNAINWLLAKGGIFKFLPGNWHDVFSEQEIMDRINGAKDKFKKTPPILKKTNADLSGVGQVYIDGYNQGYNIGFKQDGPNAAQAIVDGTYTLEQQVDGVNTADIPVIIASPSSTPDFIDYGGDGSATSTSVEKDTDAINKWIGYWQQGWIDGYTDGFRQTMIDNGLPYSSSSQTAPGNQTIISNPNFKNNLPGLFAGKNKNKNKKPNPNQQKGSLDKNSDSDSGFPWGWILFGGVIIAGGGVGYYYYNKKKQEKSL